MIKQLVKIRKEKKITQTDMASKLAISRVNLWRYENKQIDIPFHTFCNYANELGFEVKLMLK